MVYWNSEDVYLALIGGVLIGIATSIHYLVKGRVTGFSGIYYSLITYDKSSFYWKLALMSSVALAGAVMFKAYNNGSGQVFRGAGSVFDPPSELTAIGWAGCIIAGLMVGFGTKMGNGCTSGHGVCGLPRLSTRSAVAVGTFIGTGMIVATAKYHIFGYELGPVMFDDYGTISIVFLVISAIVLIGSIYGQYVQDSSKLSDALVAAVVGFVFGLGLVISGMVKRSKILGFLTINQYWDPSLAFVMISAVGVNFITFRLLDKPIMNTKYEVPTNKVIDLKLVLGACIFGAGWGIGGLCPGPAVALYTEFTVQVGILFMLCLGIGQIVAAKTVEIMDSRNTTLLSK